MKRVFEKVIVQSEKNMKEVLDTIKDIDCESLIDELEKTEFRVFKYKTFPLTMLKRAGLNKEQLAKWMGIEGVTFDPAVPQDWLNHFVDQYDLDYHEFLSTIVFAYPTGLPSGIISGCTEFDNLLGNYSGRYDGKWERVDCEQAPEGTREREWNKLHLKIRQALRIYNESTGDIIQEMSVDWEDDGTFNIEYLH